MHFAKGILSLDVMCHQICIMHIYRFLQQVESTKKDVIQRTMFLEFISKLKSFSALILEMSTFSGPCFCLPASRVLGQVQVRQVVSRSRAKK